jgi:hypothetical protein
MSRGIRGEIREHTLVLLADNEARADLRDGYKRDGYCGAEQVVCEGLHEQFDFVAPEYVPGALTDAPILTRSDDRAYPDNGEVVLYPSARIFWFPNYMVEDPWETLKNTGRVKFREAEPYEMDLSGPILPRDRARYLPGGDRHGYAFFVGEGPAGQLAEYSELPELMDEYKRADDHITPGLYYFDASGDACGPYSPAIGGIQNLERAGGKIWRETEQEEKRA